MSAIVHQGLSPVRHVLPNGATLIAERTETHPAVTILASLHAGSAYDPPDRVGLAHYVSRVIDRGTERRSADEIAEAFDGCGVSLNTSVARHTLTVSCTCLAEDLEFILDLLGDVIRRPVFPDAEVATRRGEIVTAIRQDADNPSVRASEALFECLYPDGHPYGRLTKGTVEGVEAMTRESLVAFHRARFAPAGTILVLVGDVTTTRAMEAASRVFGDWNAPAAPLLIPPRAAQPVARQRLRIPMPSKAQADVAYGFTTVRRLDPDYYPLVLMNNVFGQYGLGGRLGDSIRERQGMAYYVFSTFDGNVAEGPLVIRAGVAPENVDRTIASIDEEVRSMVASGVTSAELQDAKRYLVGSLPRTLETNGGIASFLQSAEFFGLGLDLDRRLPALLERVTDDEVHAAARRVLDVDQATIVVAGPPGVEADLKTRMA